MCNLQAAEESELSGPIGGLAEQVDGIFEPPLPKGQSGSVAEIPAHVVELIKWLEHIRALLEELHGALDISDRVRHERAEVLETRGPEDSLVPQRVRLLSRALSPHRPLQ